LILKERGCGIEKSLQHLVSNLYDERIESDQEWALINSVRFFVQDVEKYRNNAATLQAQMDSIRKQFMIENDEFLNQLREKDAVISKFKEKVSKLEKTILIQNQQISTLRTFLDKTQKDLDLLTHEYVMARRRISMLQPAAAEKICMNCKKAYKEEENFNWSCKTHLSEYSGNAWWCCGKSLKEDEGCSVSRHLSKDEIENDKQIKSSKAICSVFSIQSCKEKGHSSFNCPKDPNLKSNEFLMHELMRMESLAAEKISKKKSVCELNENIKKTLGVKQPDYKLHQMDSIKVCQFTSFDDIEDMKKSAKVHNSYLKVKQPNPEPEGTIEAKVYKKRTKNKSISDFPEF
jgi:hypothetical protein